MVGQSHCRQRRTPAGALEDKLACVSRSLAASGGGTNGNALPGRTSPPQNKVNMLMGPRAFE